MNRRNGRIERYYCAVCNTWTQGDAASVRIHNSGNRHKGNVQRAERDKERAKRQEDRKAEQVKRELEQLDQIARKRLREDTQPAKRQVVPQPQVHSESSFSQVHQVQREEQREEEEVEPILQSFPDQILGQYEIDGVVYLEGQLHEDLLRVGMCCEVVTVKPSEESGEMEEEWESGVIKSSQQCFSEDESIVYRVFQVLLQSSGTLLKARSSEIRLLAPAPPPTSVKVKAESETSKPSGWTTVSSTVVETPVHLKLEPKSDALYEDGDDAYATFNPFGGTYKGFDISEAPGVQSKVNFETETGLPNIESLSSQVVQDGESGVPLVFKKKKKKKN